MSTDLTRDRKVRVTLHAMWLLFGGLLACLLTALFVPNSVGLLFGLFAPYATAIGTYLGLFVNGNVRVHQAQAEAKP